jgi:hypothetical protein
MTDSLLPELPPALESLARSIYPDVELARRALLAPWPLLGFRSAYDERALWAETIPLDDAQRTRRQGIEKNLREETAPFQRAEQPYFVSPFTSGTLRSPYSELSDSEFWLYVTLYGSEQAARASLEHRLVPSLDGKTTLEYLRDARKPGLLSQLFARFGDRKQHDPRLIAWSAQNELLYPNYL